ncbi:MAG: 50S ribosomal protein L16 [Nanoarchaeota archaeon]|nr:50S ribosomal protein L16 [Nanoarchaeota archaeon]
MGLRKASSYSKKRVRPYTRKSSKKSKSYIKTIPENKIVKYKMGAINDFDKGKFKNIIRLISTEKVLIRDNSLESCRQFINKNIDRALAGQYYFEVKPFPHHILRENKALTTPGADRMQTGMQRSFGKAIGRAAIVKPWQTVFLVAFLNERSRKIVRSALEKIKSKIPCRSRIMFEKRE